jgi:hypothetical protein
MSDYTQRGDMKAIYIVGYNGDNIKIGGQDLNSSKYI